MKMNRDHLKYGLLGLCAVGCATLLMWPLTGSVAGPDDSAEHYSGPEYQPRRVSRTVNPPIHLASADTTIDSQTPEAAATPTLVGIVGGQAYLRSVSTGEVKRLAIGSTLDGWRLKTVRGRSVDLQGASGDVRLSLFDGPPRNSPTTPGQPGVPTPIVSPPVQPGVPAPSQ